MGFESDALNWLLKQNFTSLRIQYENFDPNFEYANGLIVTLLIVVAIVVTNWIYRSWCSFIEFREERYIYIYITYMLLNSRCRTYLWCERQLKFDSAIPVADRAESELHRTVTTLRTDIETRFRTSLGKRILACATIVPGFIYDKIVEIWQLVRIAPFNQYVVYMTFVHISYWDLTTLGDSLVKTGSCIALSLFLLGVVARFSGPNRCSVKSVYFTITCLFILFKWYNS